MVADATWTGQLDKAVLYRTARSVERHHISKRHSTDRYLTKIPKSRIGALKVGNYDSTICSTTAPEKSDFCVLYLHSR